MDKLIFNRQTYSLLEWLGDLGGLFDAFYLLCNVLVTPIAAFNMQATLMSNLVRVRPSNSNITQMDTQKT